MASEMGEEPHGRHQGSTPHPAHPPPQAMANKGMEVYRRYSEPGPVAADWSALLMTRLAAYANNATLTRRDEVGWGQCGAGGQFSFGAGTWGAVG